MEKKYYIDAKFAQLGKRIHHLESQNETLKDEIHEMHKKLDDITESVNTLIVSAIQRQEISEFALGGI